MKHLKFHPWEDPSCGGCKLAAMLRFGGASGSLMSTVGCADHDKPEKSGKRKTK